MIGYVVCLSLIVFAAFRCYKSAFKKPNVNFPPGPPSLPVYGAYWIVLWKELNNLGGSLRRLANQYNTKVLGMYLGQFPAVIIEDSKLIKENLYNEDLDGRLDIIIGRLRSYWKNLGIFFTDGYFWHVQRRFSLRYMRDYGFGRRNETLETVMANEIKEMIKIIKCGPKYPAEEISWWEVISRVIFKAPRATILNADEEQ